MFPISWDKMFRTKAGSLVTMDEAMSGGGGSSIPPHSESDAGKVLTVGDDGTLEWDESGAGGGFVDARTLANDTKILVLDGASSNCKYYILDVHDLSSIILIGAYDVDGLKSGYRQSKYCGVTALPEANDPVTTFLSVSGPGSGKLVANKVDVSNYNYVIAINGTVSENVSTQNFAGFCAVAPYTP